MDSDSYNGDKTPSAKFVLIEEGVDPIYIGCMVLAGFRERLVMGHNAKTISGILSLRETPLLVNTLCRGGSHPVFMNWRKEADSKFCHELFLNNLFMGNPNSGYVILEGVGYGHGPNIKEVCDAIRESCEELSISSMIIFVTRATHMDIAATIQAESFKENKEIEDSIVSFQLLESIPEMLKFKPKKYPITDYIKPFYFKARNGTL